MDTIDGVPLAALSHGAPPDGFLIDGHRYCLGFINARLDGAPPDGFLIDGHSSTGNILRSGRRAHRLTGFSSMDT